MPRSRWKVPFINIDFFSKKVLKLVTFNTFDRVSNINNLFIDKRFRVYNGRKFISFIVRKSMVGKKLGEFSITKVLGSDIALSKQLKIKLKKKKK